MPFSFSDMCRQKDSCQEEYQWPWERGDALPGDNLSTVTVDVMPGSKAFEAFSHSKI